MAQAFGFEEVLTIAIQIEVNGQAFYRKAAEFCPEHAEWLNDLADQEITHEGIYRRLKEKLVDKAGRSNLDAGDYDDLAVAYLHSIAGTVVFKLSQTPEEEFKGGETIENIIDRAIEREKDAVLFFTGIHRALKGEEDRREIDLIIDEEMRHVSQLTERKAALTA
jgi:rubrerythrin